MSLEDGTHAQALNRSGGNAPGEGRNTAEGVDTGLEGPRVSIVTVCFNAAATLKTCIESVARQTYPHIEYLVVDGGSVDGTAEILERYAARINVAISEPDAGIYDAMNKGVARATGEFLLFLNADDYLVGPRAIAEAVAAMDRVPEADVYYGSIEVRGLGFRLRHVPPPEGRAAEEMVLGCLPHQATFARRTVFERTGLFDLRWRRHADYDWWLKVLADPALRVRRIDACVASFALGGASSDLAKGQPEVFTIQNAAALYRTSEWDRRRLDLYQHAWLAARLEVARLKEAQVSPSPRRVLQAALQKQGSWRHALPRPANLLLAALRRGLRLG